MSKPMLLTESQFRALVRKMVREYVNNDTPFNANKHIHADATGANWDEGLDEGEPPTVGVDESEEDHSETHGGKKVADPRWDNHADPTARNWDTGLD